MENYMKKEMTPKRFYNEVIRWYQACQYPQTLINDIMKYHQPDTLGPYLQATPETVARIFVREYAFDNQLIYEGIESRLARISNKRKESIRQ